MPFQRAVKPRRLLVIDGSVATFPDRHGERLFLGLARFFSVCDGAQREHDREGQRERYQRFEDNDDNAASGHLPVSYLARQARCSLKRRFMPFLPAANECTAPLVEFP